MAPQFAVPDAFDGFDTSAYEPRYESIDVHGNRAYVLASFDELLRPRNGQPGILINGRAVHFWRSESDGTWRIVRLLTARSAPEEPEEPEASDHLSQTQFRQKTRLPCRGTMWP